MKSRRIGILIYPEVEVLDVAGPFEVFNLAGKNQSPKPFQVSTVAETHLNTARGGLNFKANHLISENPSLDILLVPGGPGARKEIFNEPLLEYIQDQAKQVEHLLSVCTGAMLLAQAGVVSQMPLTTHHLAVEELRALAPQNTIDTTRRIIDNGKVILSAGISAGIDMSFYVVKKLWGEAMAKDTANEMEYTWNPSNYF